MSGSSHATRKTRYAGIPSQEPTERERDRERETLKLASRLFIHRDVSPEDAIRAAAAFFAAWDAREKP